MANKEQDQQDVFLAQLNGGFRRLKTSDRTFNDIMEARSYFQAIRACSVENYHLRDTFVSICDYLLGNAPRTLLAMERMQREFFVSELDLKIDTPPVPKWWEK